LKDIRNAFMLSEEDHLFKQHLSSALAPTVELGCSLLCTIHRIATCEVTVYLIITNLFLNR
jgi:hypothetical protein